MSAVGKAKSARGASSKLRKEAEKLLKQAKELERGVATRAGGKKAAGVERRPGVG